ncbi:MAG: hypothetical protein AVDCRST_MAG07-1685, partial [uncultured Frankineae bacterium]
ARSRRGPYGRPHPCRPHPCRPHPPGRCRRRARPRRARHGRRPRAAQRDRRRGNGPVRGHRRRPVLGRLRGAGGGRRRPGHPRRRPGPAAGAPRTAGAAHRRPGAAARRPGQRRRGDPGLLRRLLPAAAAVPALAGPPARDHRGHGRAGRAAGQLPRAPARGGPRARQPDLVVAVGAGAAARHPPADRHLPGAALADLPAHRPGRGTACPGPPGHGRPDRRVRRRARRRGGGRQRPAAGPARRLRGARRAGRHGRRGGGRRRRGHRVLRQRPDRLGLAARGRRPPQQHDARPRGHDGHGAAGARRLPAARPGRRSAAGAARGGRQHAAHAVLRARLGAARHRLRRPHPLLPRAGRDRAGRRAAVAAVRRPRPPGGGAGRGRPEGRTPHV